LLLDATCAPADIAYPTDLSLLNKALEKLEHIIDVLHAPFIEGNKKSRALIVKRPGNHICLLPNNENRKIKKFAKPLENS